MMKCIRTAFIFVVLAVVASIACFPARATKNSKHHNARPGIYQLAQTRNGRTSCWGVIIMFDKMTLKDSVDQDQITVVDAKYGRDLKSIMVWFVSDKGKRFTIEFKPGM
ncbi:MAG: hypothetical protein KGJ59_07150, partial [Bacteroidota bacterium]|nr:hypothetical protein [Bacteroidota bacterium]